MAEHVDNKQLFASAGHVWVWSRPYRAAKVLRTAGTTGAARLQICTGERPGVITGRLGGPALLKATATSRDLANAALTVLENAIEGYATSGNAVAWEDDLGNHGTALVIESYEPVGPRRYSVEGVNWTAWQAYTCRVMDLAGRDV